MLASLTTLFVRVWEKALFLIALLACLTLCSLATHYFTAAPEEEDAVGHRPAAVSILPWQDRSYFSVSVPEATAANPFAHTLVVSQSNFRIGTEAAYLPTQDQIPLGGYEVNAGYYERERPFRPDADQHYVAEVCRLLDELFEKQRKDEEDEE